jgi:hypothetical protein
MLGHHAVHRVGEHEIGLARGQTHFDQLLEQAAGIDLAANTAVLGRFQGEFGAVAHGFHEFIGQQHAVVQVERLAVEVARRLADFEEFLDFRVRHRDSRPPNHGAATLRDRQRQLSITRTKGMMPLVLPFRPTFSPMPRTLPQ